MKDLFKSQIENNNPITEELLNEVQQKNYDSGEPKQVADIPLWGFKVQYEGQDDKSEELVLTLFSLCEREFDYYDERYTAMSSDFNPYITFPVFIKKGEEDKFESMKNEQLKNSVK